MLWAVSTSAESPIVVWALPPNVGGTAQRHVQVHTPTPTFSPIRAQQWMTHGSILYVFMRYRKSEQELCNWQWPSRVFLCASESGTQACTGIGMKFPGRPHTRPAMRSLHAGSFAQHWRLS